MKMRCPHCGVRGTVPDALIGRRVKCPRCNDIFKVLAEDAPVSSDKGAVREAVIEASGHVVDAGAGPGMTAHDEAALEQELAKIFDDMKRSTTDQETQPDPAPEGRGTKAVEVGDGSLSEAELESELDDILGEKCSVCGTFVGRATKHELNGNVYCSACLPDTSADTGTQGRRDLAVSKEMEQKMEEQAGLMKKLGAVLAGIVIIGLIVFASYYFTQM